jgi:hypothetical protein
MGPCSTHKLGKAELWTGQCCGQSSVVDRAVLCCRQGSIVDRAVLCCAQGSDVLWTGQCCVVDRAVLCCAQGSVVLWTGQCCVVDRAGDVPSHSSLVLLLSYSLAYFLVLLRSEDQIRLYSFSWHQRSCSVHAWYAFKNTSLFLL